MKKSAKRKTNLKMTAYERDEKRTRMRMNKIMGWNIWREHKEEQREGVGGSRGGKRMQNTCYEAHAMRDTWVQTNSWEIPRQNCRARASTLKFFQHMPVHSRVCCRSSQLRKGASCFQTLQHLKDTGEIWGFSRALRCHASFCSSAHVLFLSEDSS